MLNKNYDPQSFLKWSDLWDPYIKNQLLMLDNTHNLFSIALIGRGYPASDANSDHIQQVYLRLKRLLPNIKLFNSDAMKVDYIDEDANVGIGYSGDTYQAMQINHNVVYIYPKEGYFVWIDCIAIPKNALHLQNAYKFLNFIMRPNIAAKLNNKLGYALPYVAALKLPSP